MNPKGVPLKKVIINQKKIFKDLGKKIYIQKQKKTKKLNAVKSLDVGWQKFIKLFLNV